MKRVTVRKNSYVDSVFLMLLSKDLQDRPDVANATVAMGTPMNLELLRDQGYPEGDLADIGAADLVIALDCADEAAFAAAERLASDTLAGKKKKASSTAEEHPRSVSSAVEVLSGANIALISLPGAYAAREARKALVAGLHVMLFSDNVSLDDEISLKSLARDRGLLVMGPDCGTAIIDGKPLCFANVVGRGPVGVVAASGTGLQEVSCLIDRFGSGVSQAIGTGGRDLKNARVGGATMLQGIRALGADPGTAAIVVVSKPPAPEVAAEVVGALEGTGKPSVVHFIGLDAPASSGGRVRWAANLEEAARIGVALAGGEERPGPDGPDWPFDADPAIIAEIVARETEGMAASQKFIRGYFTGGTLADEAWLLLHRLTGAVYSNNQTDPSFVPPDPKKSIGHTVVDLGDDVFTVGRPHPMIDPSTRTDRIDAERGGFLSVIASVTGTAGDFQGFEAQIAKLRAAGVVVMPSNYQASRLAVRIMETMSGAGGAVQKNAGAKSGMQPSVASVGASPAASTAAKAAANTVAEGPVEPILSLFAGVKAVNLGLESFAENLRVCGAEAVQVDWTPPAGGNAAVAVLLDRLESGAAVDIEAANALAVERILTGKPMILGIGKAAELVPGMRKDLILHAGPPVTWERMCGPLRGAVIGGLIYEGLAADQAEAEELAASGKVSFEPCHHHSAVGPMAGVMTASMPVWIVKNETYGNQAYATLNEGLGKVLRYGAFSAEVLDRLRWMETELAPILSAAIALHGPLDLRSLIVQALQMGDEGHNRNRAGTSLVIRELAPHLVLLDQSREALSRVFAFLNGNDHFFLNLTMPAAKCVLDAASGIPGSTVITTQARNGTEFGIRISGLPDRWFTGPAGIVQGLYLPGFGPEDAAPDIGDSVITETAGYGGFAMAAAPAIVKFVGGSPADAVTFTKRMYEITLAENRDYKIPSMDFRGTPTAIDLRKVVETGILPVINTGIAHRTPGVGMVGAGLVKPPENCYRDALAAFVEKYAK